MTDREKLIELISGSGILCEICGENSFQYCAEALVDHLLANGVTFATNTNDGGKWMPTDERLPEHGDVVLCHHKHFDCQVICQWDKRSNAWLDDKWTYGTGCITHWMPLPEPPKEDDYDLS